jgi:hypothetical protein
VREKLGRAARSAVAHIVGRGARIWRNHSEMASVLVLKAREGHRQLGGRSQHRRAQRLARGPGHHTASAHASRRGRDTSGDGAVRAWQGGERTPGCTAKDPEGSDVELGGRLDTYISHAGGEDQGLAAWARGAAWTRGLACTRGVAREDGDSTICAQLRRPRSRCGVRVAHPVPHVDGHRVARPRRIAGSLAGGALLPPLEVEGVRRGGQQQQQRQRADHGDRTHAKPAAKRVHLL